MLSRRLRVVISTGDAPPRAGTSSGRRGHGGSRAVPFGRQGFLLLGGAVVGGWVSWRAAGAWRDDGRDETADDKVATPRWKATWARLRRGRQHLARSGAGTAAFRTSGISVGRRSRHEHPGPPCAARRFTRAICAGRSWCSRRLVFLVGKMRDAALIACYPLQHSSARFTNVRGRRPAPKGRAQINII